MDFFGYKKGRILIMMAAICLFAFVVLPFLRGGRSMIQTDFIPLNTQMQAMISQTEEDQVPKSNLTSKLDSKSTLGIEQKATIETEPKGALEAEPKASINTETKATIPALTAIPTPSVVSNEKPEASLPAAGSTGRLDLNTATFEQLDEIPGIGASKAKAILDYRLKKGRFNRIEELIEVKGIGEKMLEKLKAFLYVTST
ncbi:competence protein ComEA [Paenibacillus sp. V4I7]|nr:competence protein ComEA [Paenibacillus sp. V4I7]